MSKEIDTFCHLCRHYDVCERRDSQDCEKYEFYKCVDCVDRTVENDNIPRCFRGGLSCREIRYCSIK